MFVGEVQKKDTDVEVFPAIYSVKSVGGSGTEGAVVVIANSEVKLLVPALFFAAI